MDNQLDIQSLEEQNPLLEKYKRLYEGNPHSTVFAPLAECYRKMGRTDKALSILREGIKANPDYLLGYLSLGQCYYDLEQFSLAYSTLKPLIEKNRENIKLQRLFAKVCENTAREGEALEAYKGLLFLNPKDSEAAYKVSRLEDPVQINTAPKNPKLGENIDENNWQTINLQKIEVLKKIINSNHSIDKFVEVPLSSQNPLSNDSLSKIFDRNQEDKKFRIRYKLLNFLEKIREKSKHYTTQN